MTISTRIPGDPEKDAMWQLVARLFPMHRTIVGPGVTRVLDCIKQQIPLEVRAFPSGLRGGSWVVPQEWDVQEGYVETLSGRRVIDFQEHGLHVWMFSQPFEGIVSKDELLKHIRTSPVRPRAIPLEQTFYRRQWGFSASEEQVKALTESRYRVVLRTTFKDGVLRIGEAVLEGQSSREILIDAFICHPLLAYYQTGIAVAVELFKLIASLPKRRYTYRLLLTPETIGPIMYLHHNEDVRRRIVGGYSLVCVGDPGKFHYRRSYDGASVADRSMRHALMHSGMEYEIEPFDIRTGTTGNEKAYNSPGFFVPVGSIRRTHIGGYSEAWTSDDNLELISPDSLLETLLVCWTAIQTLERDVVYEPLFVGEPFLAGYGIYPHDRSFEQMLPWDYFKAFVDGRRSLLEIAERAGAPIMDFDDVVEAFLEKRLVRPVGEH